MSTGILFTPRFREVLEAGAKAENRFNGFELKAVETAEGILSIASSPR
ncbi:MAG TPA: hypothetical protein VGJ69_11750 [Pyrinomonadaceae bacterium]